MKKVKAVLLGVFSIVSTLTFAQNTNTTCANMIPICTDDLLVFDIFDTGGGLTGNNFYDCLVPTVGTNWFYLKIGTSGNIDMTMTAPTGFDLDFAVWGPFTDLAAAQAACGNLGNNTTPPSTVDCSALGGPTEQINIPNATTGEVYVMLITIPASSGSTTFELTLDPSSTGTTDCSIVCPTDPGTFSLLKATDPNDPATFVPTTSPISLCWGEGFAILSNQDYILPEDTISYANGGDSAYTAQLGFLLYDVLPNGGDPASDPGFTGVIIPDDSIVDLNSAILSPILDSLNINCGTVYFVPVTMDDGIGLNGNMPGLGDNGQLNYDLLGDGCIGLGDPIEVRYNCRLTASWSYNCQPYPLNDSTNNTISVNVNGGAEPGNVSIFSYRDGILSDANIQTPTLPISISNLNHLDTVELYLVDDAGCFDSVKTSFSIPQFVDVTMVPAAGCSQLGQVSVEGDPLTGNGGIASIIMNSVVESFTVPFDTINDTGGTQVLIILRDQAGCENDSTIDIEILNGHQIVANVVDGSVIGVSCRDGNDGTATVTAYGIDQFGNRDGVPVVSYVWTHPTAPTFGGTAIDSVLTNAVSGPWVVTITDQVGCTRILNIFIDNPDEFEVDYTFNSPLCNGDLGGGSIVINVTGGTGPYTYSALDADNDPVPTFSNTIPDIPAGLYTITITDDNGCTTSGTQTLSNPLPITATFEQKITTDCFGDSTGFIKTTNVANATLPADYSWDIPGSTAQLPSTPSIDSITAGQYRLQIIDNNGCQESWIFTIGQPTELVFDSITILPAYCRIAGFQNGRGRLSASASGGTGSQKYKWTELNTGSTTNTVTWSSKNPGPYNIFVSDFNGCTVSRDVFLDSINPKAAFQVDSDDFTGPAIYEGTEPIRVRLSNESTGYADPNDPSADVVFDWTFDRNPVDGEPYWFFTFSEEERVDTIYTGEQNFIACLAIKNYNDCVDTSCVEIISRVVPELILPNVFTPGDDSNNDEFFFPNMGVNEFKAVVFNRYGVPVFEFNEITDKWDGTNKDTGKDCSDGVYFYTYEGSSTNGTEYKGEGTVTLLRNK